MSDGVTCIAVEPPPSGIAAVVAPGIHWLRMPLPFKLDHINLWLLEDDDGWTVVDTGISRDTVKQAWEEVFSGTLDGKPVKRVIVTHYHPDHMGLAGWLTRRFGVALSMTSSEWAFAHLACLNSSESFLDAAREFYRSAGFDDALLQAVERSRGTYPSSVSPLPVAYRRLGNGDRLHIGGHEWRVIVGHGHSPEHACLFCEALEVLIAGDQILPRITPNIGVWPREPEADPLRLYLDGLPRFRRLPAATLVLPSHDRPFTGLPGRLDELAEHHRARLAETAAACAEPGTALEVSQHLFQRELDRHQLFFAIGESLAHLHFLMNEGSVVRTQREDGVHLFRRQT